MTADGHSRRAVAAVALLAGLAAAPAPALELQQWRTDKGARVLFYPAPELPMLDVRATFAAGSARDGELPGLARLTNGLLGEAAAGRDAQQIAEQFAEVGAQFGNGSLREMAWLSLRSLSEAQYLESALALFAGVLGDPAFRGEDLERLRKQMLSGIDQVEQSPAKLAERALYRTLYPGHPYAIAPEGERETVQAISREDVRGFYARHYVARNLTLALVGGIGRAEAERIAEAVSAGLAGGAAAAPLPPPPPVREARTVRVDYPSRQSHILLGAIGVSRDDPDYFPLYLANHVFGGSGFASRLLTSVREREGLAYSAYSYFLPMAVPGPFILGVQTRNAQVERTIEIALAELSKFVAEGPGPAELEASVRNVTGGFPLRIDSNRKLLEFLTLIGYYELPLDYLDTFNDRVEAVTLEQIRAALAARLDPQRMVTVVVGGDSG